MTAEPLAPGARLGRSERFRKSDQSSQRAGRVQRENGQLTASIHARLCRDILPQKIDESLRLAGKSLTRTERALVEFIATCNRDEAADDWTHTAVSLAREVKCSVRTVERFFRKQSQALEGGSPPLLSKIQKGRFSYTPKYCRRAVYAIRQDWAKRVSFKRVARVVRGTSGSRIVAEKILGLSSSVRQHWQSKKPNPSATKCRPAGEGEGFAPPSRPAAGETPMGSSPSEGSRFENQEPHGVPPPGKQDFDPSDRTGHSQESASACPPGGSRFGGEMGDSLGAIALRISEGISLAFGAIRGEPLPNVSGIHSVLRASIEKGRTIPAIEVLTDEAFLAIHRVVRQVVLRGGTGKARSSWTAIAIGRIREDGLSELIAEGRELLAADGSCGFPPEDVRWIQDEFRFLGGHVFDLQDMAQLRQYRRDGAKSCDIVSGLTNFCSRQNLQIRRRTPTLLIIRRDVLQVLALREILSRSESREETPKGWATVPEPLRSDSRARRTFELWKRLQVQSTDPDSPAFLDHHDAEQKAFKAFVELAEAALGAKAEGLREELRQRLEEAKLQGGTPVWRMAWDHHWNRIVCAAWEITL